MLVSTAILLSGLVSAIGGLIGTGMNAASQHASEQFNAEEAEKARQFSSEEAEKNRQFEAAQAELTRQWQTDMSNTAYQRSMVDMEKAGINPNILSSGALGAATGNASTPQGSQAQTSAASIGAMHYGDMFSGLSNALNAYATIQNQQLIAQMYNDTSKANNSFNNTIRRYGIDKSYSASKYRTDVNAAVNNYRTDTMANNFENSIWKYRPKNSKYSVR